LIHALDSPRDQGANRDDHQCALDGKVPEEYYPQVLHQLLVTGAVAWHYVSQGDERSFPMAKRLAIVPVVPRREELQALLDLEMPLCDAGSRKFFPEVQ
jgi:hypothetical protein